MTTGVLLAAAIVSLNGDFSVAAWSPPSALEAFNSVHEGSRQIYLIDVKPGDAEKERKRRCR